MCEGHGSDKIKNGDNRVRKSLFRGCMPVIWHINITSIWIIRLGGEHAEHDAMALPCADVP